MNTIYSPQKHTYRHRTNHPFFPSFQMQSHHSPSSILSFSFFLLVFHVPTSSSQADNPYDICAPFNFRCGEINHTIKYPFWVDGRSRQCAFPGYNFTCQHNSLMLQMPSETYIVKNIDYQNNTLTILDMDFVDQTCPISTNTTIEYGYFNHTNQVRNLTLYYNCTASTEPSGFRRLPCFTEANKNAYFTVQTEFDMPDTFADCAMSVISIHETNVGRLEDDPRVFRDVLQDGFNVSWNVGNIWCKQCVSSGGHCGFMEGLFTEPTCFCKDGVHTTACPVIDNEKRRKIRKIIIGVGAGVGGCILTCFLFFICHRYRQRRFATASKLLSRSFSSDPSSQSELGKGGSILPTHIFTYKELEDATNNFDPSKELGDGGFGTVYHGKLRDGRSVAVKRLYENNCRRVEQFMNEIDILSRLRHQSLVTLYGCTSRHSRELLLVYEFIPNGTVADHLHGNHAKDGALTWPIRMSIAIESADALAYLHAVEIIHRDVKTNNILLDNNFNVKVADFGLSRLFPTDRTHVSTAPQGTPGYVDPDYHRCYQLNNKSDVYSFGVVLIELISSKPAVDITRHRQEINLANMAINKIHNNALNELVDPTLGYESDHAVRRMITLVAELAFRCLQDEKEVRPTMQEVLEVLKGIQREDYKVEKAEELDVLAVADDAVLLKKFRPLSPDSVTDTWISRSTTPSASG
ncbi:LEAF RUST 10 DISEASE-RESISTANCE LOCUS RECEPTOR-LIKE PROTEIN KINASE-like 1.2 isoform X1 [Magnolia sinica]|uniref:LEAF RUST 10 DISEASE-RESISTANCE LOCUS RECEPTOR-LIKE PROTEIN KINASE-like 1.2 isoform X1 n=1 Tax=Magnolia sinica TaxID=86752 RepID=UPI002658346E|nr:LEAF RUST 10 DISEASE-RESISTANCE LOCUS RECEPTOR-LIKE PROTEIN KINASE-like 1.2 isoform X1 [Magnolia sinica]